MTEVKCLQDLLPAAAFTTLGWWFASLDAKALILNIGHVLQDVDGLYSSCVPFHQDCQSTNQAVNIKSSRFITGFLALVTKTTPHQHVTRFLSYWSPWSTDLCSGKLFWPDIKSDTQICKICIISIPSVCSVSTMQDREMTSLPETVFLKVIEFVAEYKNVSLARLMSLQRWSVNLCANAEDLIGYSLSEVLLFIKLVEQTS